VNLLLLFDYILVVIAPTLILPVRGEMHGSKLNPYATYGNGGSRSVSIPPIAPAFVLFALAYGSRSKSSKFFICGTNTRFLSLDDGKRRLA
jgi:hypothetical protein